MKIKAVGSIFLVIMILLSGCVVSKKKHDKLLSQKKKVDESLAKTKRKLSKSDKEVRKLESTRQQLLGDIKDWKKKYNRLKADTTELNNAYRTLKKDYDELARIASANAQQLQQELENVKQLQQELESKTKKVNEQQVALEEKERNLSALSEQLRERENRVKELERKIAEKDALLNALQDKLKKALLGFKDSGLTVEMKDGKVYVSLDNKLLFASGSHTVDARGLKALKELAKVLKEQEDILIMVEGHTDDVPFKGQVIKDNWDLSVMRATSVVKVLTKNGLSSNHVIAAGRGSYVPKIKGKSKSARAKNRRIEIIISPQLDELYQIIKK